MTNIQDDDTLKFLLLKNFIPFAGGFLFEGMSDDEEEFQSVSHKTSCSF